MIAGRLRECLKALRWEARDIAAELGCPQREVAAWLDGRSPSPLAVGAWLEALVKAHKALPAPGRSTPVLQPDSAKIEMAGTSITGPAVVSAMHVIPTHSPYPRRAALSGARPVAGPTQSKGGTSHGSRAV